MTKEEKIQLDLHNLSYEDYVLRNGELALVSRFVYCLVDFETHKMNHFDIDDNFLFSMPYPAHDHILLLSIKKNLIKKKRFDFIKSFFRFKKC